MSAMNIFENAPKIRKNLRTIENNDFLTVIKSKTCLNERRRKALWNPSEYLLLIKSLYDISEKSFKLYILDKRNWLITKEKNKTNNSNDFIDLMDNEW